jgi:hypothetical protein
LAGVTELFFSDDDWFRHAQWLLFTVDTDRHVIIDDLQLEFIVWHEALDLPAVDVTRDDNGKETVRAAVLGEDELTGFLQVALESDDW